MLCVSRHPQANESDRIKKDIEKFAGKVRNYKMDIRKRTFFKYATGSEAAYKELDVVAADLLGLRKECDKHYELATTFEFPQVRGVGGEAVPLGRGGGR